MRVLGVFVMNENGAPTRTGSTAMSPLSVALSRLTWHLTVSLSLPRSLSLYNNYTNISLPQPARGTLVISASAFVSFGV